MAKRPHAVILASDMEMGVMGIVLPRDTQAKAAKMASDRGFASVEDYLAHLVARDAVLGDEPSPALEAELIAGLEQDEPVPVDLDAIRREARSRVLARRSTDSPDR